jgi:hypothetical protein
MEGNGYFMPLRNAKRYTPYEFDKMMSHNENRMNHLGKIIDQDIYNCMMADRKTPLVLTPKLILDNSNGINSIAQKNNPNTFNSQSQRISKNPLQQISRDSFKIAPQSPRHMNPVQRQKFMDEENNIINNNKELQNNLNDEFTKYNPEEDNNSHWKYDGPSNYNLEKKHYPRINNNESYYRNRNDEPVKINQDYNNTINNIYRSQEIPRNRSNNNYVRMRRPTPYNDGYNDRNNDRYNNNNYNDRYNNNNFEEPTNGDFRNNRNRAFSPQNNNYNNKNNNFNEDSKEKLDYVRRGYYNSQLNFPFDRYED